ncbi:MAG: ROK family protein [Gaiellaceae bacterium]
MPVLALDIGGTKLAAGVVDAAGAVHSFFVAPSNADRGPEDGLERLFDLGRRAVEDAALSIGAVGIGCGGPLDSERGVLLSPLHLPGWRDVPVVQLASAAFERPAALENDATAGAAGEHRFGAGAGTSHMVYLTLSTGVGGGVIADGRLYRGAMGNGGELGHVTVDCNGRLCRGCGRRGCLEAYASGTSIGERAAEALAAGDEPSMLAALARPAAADVAAAARDGDPLAVRLWDETVTMLACGLTSIVNLFEPELVVLGGGVTRVGEQLLGPVRTAVQSHAVRPAGSPLGIVQSALGDHVGIVGAAAIVYDRIASGLIVAHG